jgi:DNA-directed RNA polymerase specialized sigma24 family protein
MDAGEAGGRFPETRASAVLGLSGDDPQARAAAIAAVAAAYWAPVYKYVRIRWQKGRDEAEDLTQAFFATMLDRGFFSAYEPARARFRTYVRACEDRFVLDDNRRRSRFKRGGGAPIASLDCRRAEGELALEPPDPTDLDALFDEEWKRALFGVALERLQAECAAHGKTRNYKVFCRYDVEAVESVTYSDVARELGLSVSEVTNALHAARRDFRLQVLAALRELTTDERELELEARALGIVP